MRRRPPPHKVAGHQRQADARAGEAPHGRAADAARGPGDDDDFCHGGRRTHRGGRGFQCRLRGDNGRMYRQALKSVGRGSALPYGYTLTVWCSGAVLMHHHGPPPVGDVFLFLLGGVAAFPTLATVARGAPDPPEPQPADLLATGAAHFLAAAGAVGAVALIAEIGGGIAWALGAFAATLVYLLLATLELTIVRR